MIPVAVVALMPLVDHTELAAAVEKRRDELWHRAQEPLPPRFVIRNDSVLPEATQLDRTSSRLSHGRVEAEVQPQDDPVAALARRNELIQRACDRYWAGELDKALDDMTVAIKIDPECAKLWFSRATMWADKKEYSKALDDLDRAHKLDPKSADTLASRGELRRIRGELDKAEFDLIAALNLDPKCGEAWRNRGILRSARREYELATTDLTQAIELAPKDPICLVWRGHVWGRRGDWEKAIDDITKAIELDPKSVLALCTRGDAYLHQQEYDKAFDDFNRAVKLDPKNADALTGRGVVHAVRQNYKDAVAEYEKAIEHDPKSTDALYYLTGLYALGMDDNLRDPKKAVTRGKQLVEAAPAKWSSRQALAVAHAEAGDFDAAVNGMRKVLESVDLSHEDRETAEWYIELFLTSKTVSSTREE